MKIKKGLLILTSCSVFVGLILGIGILNGQAQVADESALEEEIYLLEKESLVAVCTPDAAGMRAYWPLNDGPAATSFEDVVANPALNSGACVGAACPTSTTSGKVGSAFNFDGNDEVLVSDTSGLDFTITGDISVEAWIKTTQACTSRVVFVGRYEESGLAAWWLGCDENNHAGFHMRDSNNNAFTISGNTVINDGQWHHIVGTRDGTANSNMIYVDGALEDAGTPAFTGLLSFTTKPITIGYFSVSPFYWFNGTLDEIALYDQALPAGEVARHYLDGTGQSYCNDDLPIPGGVTFQTQKDTPFPFTEAELLVNDIAPDGGLNLVSIDPTSQNGGLITGSGPFTYTPPAGYTGNDTFNYVIADVDGDQATGEATVQVKQDTEPNKVYLPLLVKNYSQ